MKCRKYLVKCIGRQVAHQAAEDEGFDAREYFIDFRQRQSHLPGINEECHQEGIGNRHFKQIQSSGNLIGVFSAHLKSLDAMISIGINKHFLQHSFYAVVTLGKFLKSEVYLPLIRNSSLLNGQIIPDETVQLVTTAFFYLIPIPVVELFLNVRGQVHQYEVPYLVGLRQIKPSRVQTLEYQLWIVAVLRFQFYVNDLKTVNGPVQFVWCQFLYLHNPIVEIVVVDSNLRILNIFRLFVIYQPVKSRTVITEGLQPDLSFIPPILIYDIRILQYLRREELGK